MGIGTARLTRARSMSGIASAAIVGLAAVGACTSTTTPSAEPGAGGAPAASRPPVVNGLAQTAMTVNSSGTPKQGRVLTYVLEGDTDGFDPAVSRMVAPGLIMANTVYDPLAAYDETGTPRPYLAESITSTPDYRTWTIELRADVTFHDGTPLDADALALHISKMRSSPLTQSALDLIDETTPTTKVDDLTVEVNMTDAWALFPVLLTGQLGLVPAPSFYENPDASFRADHPVGTGPFKLKDRVKGQRTELERNENYWRKDAAGVALPYLSGVTFLFEGDNKARDDMIAQGEANMEFTSFATSAQFLTNRALEGQGQVVRDTGSEEQLFLLMNMDKPPLDDVRVRRAVAHAIDRNRYVDLSKDDPAWINDGLFAKSSQWYVDTDFPDYEPDKARALVKEYADDKGSAPTFSIKTGDSVENQALGQLVVQMLTDVGMDVKAEVVPIDQYPTQMVFGQYDVGYVRLFGSTDPEGDRYWFESKNASRPGEGRLGLNLARVRDPQIDEALAKARATTDVATRKEAYKVLQERLTELVPFVWLTTAVKYIGADTSVRNITNGPLPDGTPSMPIVVGVTRLTHTWLN